MSEAVLNEWQIALTQKKHEVEACQATENIKSCLQCEKLLDCQTRDSYIKAVYDSMNKGQGGGFEF